MSSYFNLVLVLVLSICGKVNAAPPATVDDITIIENIEVVKKKVKKATPHAKEKQIISEKVTKEKECHDLHALKKHPIKEKKDLKHFKPSPKTGSTQVKKLEEKYQELKEAFKITTHEADALNELRKQNEVLRQEKQTLERERNDIASATTGVADIVEKMSETVKDTAQKIRALETLINENRQATQTSQNQIRFTQEALKDYHKEINSMRDMIRKQNDLINRLSESSIVIAQKLDQNRLQINDHAVTLNQYGGVINKQTTALKNYGDAINAQARLVEKEGRQLDQMDSLHNDHILRFRDVEGKVAQSRTLTSQQMERIANLEAELARRFTSLAQGQQESVQRQQNYVQQQIQQAFSSQGQSPAPTSSSFQSPPQPHYAQAAGDRGYYYAAQATSDLPSPSDATGAYSVERVEDCYIPRSTRR